MEEVGSESKEHDDSRSSEGTVDLLEGGIVPWQLCFVLSDQLGDVPWLCMYGNRSHRTAPS